MVAGNTAYCPKAQGAPEPKYLETKTQRPSELLSLRTPESMTHYGNKLLGVPTWWPYGDLWSKDTSVLLVAYLYNGRHPWKLRMKSMCLELDLSRGPFYLGEGEAPASYFLPQVTGAVLTTGPHWEVWIHTQSGQGDQAGLWNRGPNNICLVLCSFQGSWGHTVWKWGQTFLYVSAFCGLQRHKAGFENLRGLQGPSR